MAGMQHAGIRRERGEEGERIDDYSAQGWTNGPNARRVAMLTLEISPQSGESIFMDKKQLRVRRSSYRIKAGRESVWDIVELMVDAF